MPFLVLKMQTTMCNSTRKFLFFLLLMKFLWALTSYSPTLTGLLLPFGTMKEKILRTLWYIFLEVAHQRFSYNSDEGIKSKKKNLSWCILAKVYKQQRKIMASKTARVSDRRYNTTLKERIDITHKLSMITDNYLHKYKNWLSVCCKFLYYRKIYKNKNDTF